MSKKRILIVEDEMLIAVDIKNTLESWGYEVPFILSSADEALRKCQTIGFDLIIMDIKVKGKVNGITAANQIAKKYEIPVLYLSAYSDRITLQEAKLNTLFGYLGKPFINNDLNTAVRWLTADRETKKISPKHRDKQLPLNFVSS